MPVVRMEAVLRGMAAGEQLHVLADDPIAAVDIPHFARAGGHAASRLEAEEGVVSFLVTRGPPSTD